MRHIRALPAVAVLAFALTACGGIAADPAPTSTATAAPPAPTATPDIARIFHGFVYPIRGACLPQSDTLMPNAPREYRGGVHEGVDFYGHDNCASIELGTPAVAAKDGVVIRADLGYRDLTQDELDAADERIAAGQANDADIIDLFRGRQVWIDHGNGIVTRYAHLEGIAPGIREGVSVVQGQTVGLIGDSGTPESLSAPDTEIHLHWEMRVGETFLGEGLPPADVRALFDGLFQPPP